MDFLPEEICEAWKNREEVTSFATVDDDGSPNVIYVTCIDLFEDKQFVVLLHESNSNYEFRLRNCRRGVYFPWFVFTLSFLQNT